MLFFFSFKWPLLCGGTGGFNANTTETGFAHTDERMEKAFSKQTLIGGFTIKYGAFALLWGSLVQFNYIKRQLNWILQADKA